MKTTHEYHNTTDLTGEQLAKAERAATGQEALILAFFRHNEGEKFTPSQVWDHLFKQLRACPLTSVRRAITQLTRKELLVQTSTQRIGPYGRPEFCWTAAGTAQTSLF